MTPMIDTASRLTEDRAWTKPLGGGLGQAPGGEWGAAGVVGIAGRWSPGGILSISN